eukprot:7526977-Alexandrium_andersonii.AAC.1
MVLAGRAAVVALAHGALMVLLAGSGAGGPGAGAGDFVVAGRARGGARGGSCGVVPLVVASVG